MTHYAVISARRPQNVPSMKRFLPPGATWYVAEGEGDSYRWAGADNVVEAGDLITARNRALDDAHSQGVPCVQVSDDLRKMSHAVDGRYIDTTLTEAVDVLARAASNVDARLAGVNPVYNAMFVAANPMQTHHFIVGDLIWVAPSEPRFDPALRLKEDYDFTAQHLLAYGAVARCGWVQARFLHRSNRGGAVAYRNAAVEQEAIAVLRAKWGDAIKDNPRRPNEVLFDGLAVLARRDG